MTPLIFLLNYAAVIYYYKTKQDKESVKFLDKNLWNEKSSNYIEIVSWGKFWNETVIKVEKFM